MTRFPEMAVGWGEQKGSRRSCGGSDWRIMPWCLGSGALNL
jgi:hypothetical protein